MFNQIILIGNLTKEPELRYTCGGTPVATLGVAVNTKYKQGGEVKEEVLYIDCIVFGKQAEACGQYLSKGSKVLIEGRLRERQWEYEGKKHRKSEIVTNTVRFLSKKEGNGHPSQDMTPPSELTDMEAF